MPQSACPKWVDGRWGAAAMGNNLKMLEMAKDSENSAKNRELRMQGSFNESWRRDEGSENQVCATCIKPGGLIKAAGLIKAGGKNNNLVQSATSLKLQRPKPKKFGLHTGNNFQMFKINQRSRDMIWNENFHKIKNTRLTNLENQEDVWLVCSDWCLQGGERERPRKGESCRQDWETAAISHFFLLKKPTKPMVILWTLLFLTPGKGTRCRRGRETCQFSFPFGANVLNFFLSGANVRKLCSVRNLLQYTLPPQVTQHPISSTSSS